MKKLKYIDIAEKLEKDIKENYNSGDLYLSISALKEKYNISLDTINKALSILERKDLILRIHGKGTFVGQQTQNKEFNILIINDYDIKVVLKQNYTKEEIEGVYEYITAKNIKISFNTSDNVLANPNIIDQYDGFLFMSIQENITNLARLIKKANKKIVSVTHSIVSDNVYNVDTDISQGMEQIFDYLKQMGHKKVGLIMNICNGTHYHDKLRIYEYINMAEKYDIETKEEWIVNEDSHYVERKTLSKIKALSKDEGPTAYIISSFEYSKSLFIDEFLRIRHPQVKRLSIIGFDIPVAMYFYSERPTFIKQNFKQLGKKGIETLINLLNNEPTERLQIVPHELITGTTVLDIIKGAK